MAGGAGEGDGIEEDARAERAFDAVGFLEDGVSADDAPDEESGGGEAGVEVALLAIFQKQILAGVAPDLFSESCGLR